MKIFGIGRNYADHAKELDNDVPDEPVVFLKPSSALLVNDKPFYLPDFSDNVHFEGELVIRISKNGKAIQPEFASQYYDQVAFGIDLTARDIQKKCKDQGLPWALAKGFDGSAVLSSFVPIEEAGSPIEFSLRKNGEIVQKGNSADMIFTFEDIIVYLSRYFRLLQGDLIYTGTPAGVGPIAIGDLYEGYIGEKQLLHCEIR